MIYDFVLLMRDEIGNFKIQKLGLFKTLVVALLKYE